KVVERQAEFAAVSFARPAGDQVGEDRGDAALIGRVVDAAGRHAEIEGGRAHMVHPLREQRQAVGVSVLEDFLRHGGRPRRVVGCRNPASICVLTPVRKRPLQWFHPNKTPLEWYPTGLGAGRSAVHPPYIRWSDPLQGDSASRK